MDNELQKYIVDNSSQNINRVFRIWKLVKISTTNCKSIKCEQDLELIDEGI